MSYGEELAATRAVLDLPTVGVSNVPELDMLRRLIAKYPAEARRAVGEVERT